MILDTSVLVDALTGPRRSLGALRAAIDRGDRLLLPTLVLYEWLRGPRERVELALQRDLFPADTAVPFGPDEAASATRLYAAAPRARAREVDIAIAAHALVLDAPLWTLNKDDFADLPGLNLASP
jgi:predicted nucleic acid-binding protein